MFLEYAWDMAWCDPCAADPLSRDQLAEAGRVASTTTARPTFISRLHVRYDAAHFPEDLVFQETSNQRELPGAVRPAASRARGRPQCQEATRYRQRPQRAAGAGSARTSPSLTGWKIEDIRRKAQGVKVTEAAPPAAAPWYRKVWAALVWD